MSQNVHTGLVCCLLLGSPLAAQLPRDSFLVVGQSLMYPGPAAAFFVSPSGLLSFTAWPAPVSTSTAVALEDGETLYVAEPSSYPFNPFNPGTYRFYRASVGPNRTIQNVQQLGHYPNPTNSLITALAVAGDSLWFATRAALWQTTTGFVGTLSKTQPNQNVSTLLDLGQLGYSQTFGEARSNGRDVVLWGHATSSAAGVILSLDTSTVPPTIRSLPVLYHSGCIANGQLLSYSLIGTNLYQFTLADVVTGTITPIPGAYYAQTPDTLDYNPWTRTLLIRYFGTIGSDFSILLPSVGQWQLCGSTLQNGYGAFLLPIHEEPVVIYGRGCVNATGRDPRLSWSGLPEQGGTLTLRLRDAEASSLVLFWIGTSRTAWGSIPLPMDGGPFGAPGCRLLAAPDVWQITIADAAGVATLDLTLPVDPVLVGLRLFTQTGSATTVNPFGFVTSDALELRFR